MRLAVSSSGKDLASQIDPRFGRCAYLIICDTDDMSFEAFENESAMLGGGAGIQSAQFVASKGAEAVITGNCGPNAVRTLESAGIRLFVGESGTVKEGIERFKNNELKAAQEANVPDHFGMKGGDASSRQGAGGTGPVQSFGRGMGMGGGRGMGRGMGMGGGRGMGRGMGIGVGGIKGTGIDMTGSNESKETFQKNLSKDQELGLLKKQSEELLRQIEDIQARIKRIEAGN
jgi:predicted Fe-Mo cluster-binding NifX family protein